MTRTPPNKGWVTFTVRRRETLGFNDNPYGRRMRYGKWIRLRFLSTLEAGLAALSEERAKGGLYDWALFASGKRLDDGHGLLRGCRHWNDATGSATCGSDTWCRARATSWSAAYGLRCEEHDPYLKEKLCSPKH